MSCHWPPGLESCTSLTSSELEMVIFLICCCELMLTLIQHISQSPVPKADQPAHLPDVEIKHMTSLQMGYILPWCSQTHLTSLWFLVCLWHWTVLSYRAIICSRLWRVKLSQKWGMSYPYVFISRSCDVCETALLLLTLVCKIRISIICLIT